MIPVVEGKHCILEMFVGGGFKPLLCAENFTFTSSQEIILKTGPNSGLARERKARLTDWGIEVSGLTPIDDDDTIGFFYLLQIQVRREAKRIRATYEDQAGTTAVITGWVIIESQEIAASMTDFANASISMVGTGDYTLDEVIDGSDTECEVLLPLEFTLAEGETSITDASLLPESGLTKSIAWLAREGDTFAYTSGIPVNDEFAFNPATGTITFDPLVPAPPDGQGVEILLKIED